MDMSKTTVKRLLGFQSDAELARFFGLSRGAVFHWPETEAIPESRQWELSARRPDLFPKPKPEAA